MKIGAHESVAGGIYKAIERAVQDECEALQVFVKSPNRWSGAEPKPQEVEVFLKEGEAFGFENITAHAAYLINLASPKDDVRNNSIASLLDELKRCDMHRIPFHVLHPGSPLDTGLENGIDRIVAGIDEIFGDNDIKTTLLLENTAGGGATIGGRFEELEAIIDSLTHSDRVGVCLDSCHMFASGYDIINEYDKIFDEAVSRFGDKLKVFHLNDSKTPLGSRKDRHELIGKGNIGSEFFKRIINDDRFKDKLGILETPVAENYAEEIAVLKSFRK